MSPFWSWLRVVGNGDKLLHADLGVFGKASVPMDAEQFQVLAHMAEAASAGGAVTAGDNRVHQNPLAQMEGSFIAFRQGLNGAEDFMAEHAGDRGGHVLVAVDDHVRAADAAVADFDQGFIRARHRHGNVGELELEPVF